MLFTVQGYALNPIKQIISATSATVIATGSLKTVSIPFFRISEYAGGTPNLTVEIFNTVTSARYYLGASSFTWNTKAVTALQSLLFDDGYDLDLNDQLRVTCSVANNVLVTGNYFGKQNTVPWSPLGGVGKNPGQ